VKLTPSDIAQDWELPEPVARIIVHIHRFAMDRKCEHLNRACFHAVYAATGQMAEAKDIEAALDKLAEMNQ